MDIAHITPANGNVFADLGLDDAENLRLRAQLMIEVKRFIEESGLKQREAAKAMKTTETRVSEVMHGRIEKCTIDRLVNMLAEVGRYVRITVDTRAA